MKGVADVAYAHDIATFIRKKAPVSAGPLPGKASCCFALARLTTTMRMSNDMMSIAVQLLPSSCSSLHLIFSIQPSCQILHSTSQSKYNTWKTSSV
mmetsp:Transcript_13966/g.21222  ORF Transcript_13966/g.21222 Transcript_13966/m.21222 type:complete len:96 (+) Transcript_13966:561-848(+)